VNITEVLNDQQFQLLHKVWTAQCAYAEFTAHYMRTQL